VSYRTGTCMRRPSIGGRRCRSSSELPSRSRTSAALTDAAAGTAVVAAPRRGRAARCGRTAGGWRCEIPGHCIRRQAGRDVKIFEFVNLYGCEIGDETKIGHRRDPARREDRRRVKVSSHTFICEGVEVEATCHRPRRDLHQRPVSGAVQLAGELQTDATGRWCRPSFARSLHRSGPHPVRHRDRSGRHSRGRERRHRDVPAGDRRGNRRACCARSRKGVTFDRVLVTGAQSRRVHIADALVRAGASEIVVLDDFSRGRRENLRDDGHRAPAHHRRLCRDGGTSPAP